VRVDGRLRKFVVRDDNSDHQISGDQRNHDERKRAIRLKGLYEGPRQIDRVLLSHDQGLLV